MNLLEQGMALCFVTSPSPQLKVLALVGHGCYTDRGRLPVPLVPLIPLVPLVLLVEDSLVSVVVMHLSADIIDPSNIGAL